MKVEKLNFSHSYLQPVCHRPAMYLGPNFTFEKILIFLRGAIFGLSAHGLSNNLELDFRFSLEGKYDLAGNSDFPEIYRRAYPELDEAARLAKFAEDFETFAQS